MPILSDYLFTCYNKGCHSPNPVCVLVGIWTPFPRICRSLTRSRAVLNSLLLEENKVGSTRIRTFLNHFFLTCTPMNGVFNDSGEQFQRDRKDAVLMSRFTGFMQTDADSGK